MTGRLLLSMLCRRDLDLLRGTWVTLRVVAVLGGHLLLELDMFKRTNSCWRILKPCVAQSAGGLDRTLL